MATETLSPRSSINYNSTPGTTFLLLTDASFSAAENTPLFHPRSYWQNLLRVLLVKPLIGSRGHYSNPGAIITEHTMLLQRIAPHTQTKVAQFLRTGEESLLQILQDQKATFGKKTLSLNLHEQQLIADLLEQLVDGDFIPFTFPVGALKQATALKTPALDKARAHDARERYGQTDPEALAEVLQKELQLLSHRDLGVGGQVDISRVIRTRTERIMEIMAQRADSDQAAFVNESTKRCIDLLNQPTIRHAAKAEIRILASNLIQNSKNDLLPSGKRTLLLESIANPETTLNTYTTRLEDRNVGLKGRYSLSENLQDFWSTLITELSKLPWSQQESFLTELTRLFIAKIESLKGQNRDLSRYLFETLEFVLFDPDSPIVIARKNAEQQQRAARVKQTLYPLQQQFLSTLKDNPEAIKELAFAVAANNLARTYEQTSRYELHLFNIREALLVSSDTDQRADQARSFIAGTEKLVAHLVERGAADENIIRRWLMWMSALNPAAFADLALTLQQQERIVKTNRYQPRRVEAARSAISLANSSTVDDTNIGYHAGGKIIPRRLPGNTRLTALLAQGMDHHWVGSVIAEKDMYSVLGDEPPGPDLWMFAIPGEDDKSLQARMALVKTTFEKTIQMLETGLLENEQFEPFLRSILYFWSSALRVLGGDSEAIKDDSGIRRRYLDLLITILENEKLVQTQELIKFIISRHLPYWPLADQQYFLQTLAAKAIYKDKRLLQLLPAVSKQLSVNYDGSLPAVEGEEPENLQIPGVTLLEGINANTGVGIRKQVAAKAVAALAFAVQLQQLTDGRSSRYPLVPLLLGYSNYKALAQAGAERIRAAVLAKSHFVIEALDAISFIGSRQDLMAFVEQLQGLISKDAVSMILAINPPPREVESTTDFIVDYQQKMESAAALMSEKLVQATNSIIRATNFDSLELIEQPLEQIPTLSQAAEAINTKLTQYFQQGLEKLQHSGNEDIAAAATVLVNSARDSSDLAATHLLSRSEQGQTKIVPEDVLKVIKEVGTSAVTEQDKPRGGLNITNVSGIGALIAEVKSGNAAQAAAKLFAEIAGANAQLRQAIAELLENSGATATAQAQSALTQELIKIAGVILTDEKVRKELTLRMQQTLEAKERELLVSLGALALAKTELERDFVSKEISIQKESLDTLIELKRQGLQAKLDTLKETQKMLQTEFQIQVVQYAEQVLTLTKGLQTISVQDLNRMQEYLLESLRADGPVVAALETLQRRLNELELPRPVKFNLPDPKTLQREYGGVGIQN